MVFLSQEGLLGTIVPDVRISKITLETGGSALRESNPHVDVEREPENTRNPRTGKLERVFIRPNFQDKSEEGTPLRITVDLVLKEKLDDSLISTWFGNQDFSKYLRVKLIQTTNERITNTVTADRTLLEVMDSSRARTLSALARMNAERRLSARLQVGPFQLRKTLNDAVKIRTFNVKDEIQRNDRDLQRQYTEIDSDGNQITTLTLRHTFEVPKHNPDHLAYFAFTFIDLTQLAADFGIDPNIGNFGEPIGKAVSDIVFQNGDLVSNSFVYTTSEGRIWVGPISEAQGSFFGNDGTELQRTQVPNSKVQDFRNFEDINRLTLDFSFLENEVLRRKDENPFKDAFGRTILPKQFFSDIKLARDEDGNARFLFSIDYKRLLTDVSCYGKLFKRRETFLQAFQNSALLHLRVFRKRVRGSPEAGSPADGSKEFEDNQVDDLIVTSGEQTFKNFREVSTDSGHIREIERIATPEALPEVRHFTGVDKDMQLVTDGYYRYGIELEIRDAVFDFIFEKLRNLELARNNLFKYFQEGTQTSSAKRQVVFTNAHIDYEGEKVQFNEEVAGNFDPATNRFTQEFIEQQRNRFLSSDDSMTPWGMAVAVYLRTLRLFTDEQDFPYEDFENRLLYFVHPTTGNPRGIQKMLDAMDGLSKTLFIALGLDPAVTNLKGLQETSTPKKTILGAGITPKRSITVRYVFNEIFNSSVDNATGYDFLDISNMNKSLNGLKTITGDEYNDRVEKETDRFFVRQNGISPNIDIRSRDQEFSNSDSIDNTSYSYLTPARVSIRNRFNLSRLGNSPTPANLSSDLAAADMCIRAFNSTPQPLRAHQTNNNINIRANIQNLRNDAIGLFAQLGVSPILPNITKVNPTVDINLAFDDVRKVETVDPIVETHTACPVDSETIEVGFVPLLADLARRLTIPTTNPRLGLANSPNFSSNEKRNEPRISLSNFDLNNPQNNLNRLIEDKKFSAEVHFQGEPHTTTLNDAVKAFPNQLKSLYLSRVNPNIVRVNWFNRPEDPVLSNEEATEFRLSYRMINVVKVFRGYEKDEDGNPLIRKPIWEPLTLQKYNDSTGQALLCRLVPYENKLVGVERDPALELPLFDEYFILTPQRDAILEIPQIIPPPVVEVRTPTTPPTRVFTPLIDPEFGPQSLFTLDGEAVQNRGDSLERNDRMQFSLQTEYTTNNLVNNDSNTRSISDSSVGRNLSFS